MKPGDGRWHTYRRLGTFRFLGRIALGAPVGDDTLAALRTQRAFEIARDTLEVPDEVTPNDDPTLAYRLGVPGDWAGPQRADPAGDKSLVPQSLGSFAKSAEPGSPVIGVSVTRFPFEIPVDAWVRHTLAQQGYTLVAGRYFPGPNSIFFDATATRGDPASLGAKEFQSVRAVRPSLSSHSAPSTKYSPPLRYAPPEPR